jgi:hypothetical protein
MTLCRNRIRRPERHAVIIREGHCQTPIPPPRLRPTRPQQPAARNGDPHPRQTNRKRAPMPDVQYQVGTIQPSSTAECVEAARRTLDDMGSSPVTTGPRVHADLGSWARTRAFVGLVCPLDWLPLRVTVDVSDTGSQREVSVNVCDRLPFGPIQIGRGRYSKACSRTAMYVSHTITEHLNSGR